MAITHPTTSIHTADIAVLRGIKLLLALLPLLVLLLLLVIALLSRHCDELYLRKLSPGYRVRTLISVSSMVVVAVVIVVVAC